MTGHWRVCLTLVAIGLSLSRLITNPMPSERFIMEFNKVQFSVQFSSFYIFTCWQYNQEAMNKPSSCWGHLIVFISGARPLDSGETTWFFLWWWNTGPALNPPQSRLWPRTTLTSSLRLVLMYDSNKNVTFLKVKKRIFIQEHGLLHPHAGVSTGTMHGNGNK